MKYRLTTHLKDSDDDNSLKWLAERQWRKKSSHQETFLLNFLENLNGPATIFH
jgi:hypothetical protein